MIGFFFLGFLPWIPASMLVLFFFVALNVIYRAVTVPSGFDKENDGQCAACGYVLGSLSHQQCPECGVDLLKAGVITRRMYMQLRGSTAGALAAWSILFFSTAGTALAIWGSVINTNQVMNTGFGGSMNYTQIASYGPETSWDEENRELLGEDFTARIEMVIDSMSQQRIGDVSLILEMPDGTEYTMEVDDDLAWKLENEKGKKVESGDELNPDVVDKLFEMGGFDISDETYRSFSSQLSVLVEQSVDNGLNTNGTGFVLREVQGENDPSMNLSDYGWNTVYNNQTGAYGASLFPSVPFEVWSPVLYTFILIMVVYLVGVLYILRKRRSLLKLGNYTTATALDS